VRSSLRSWHGPASRHARHAFRKLRTPAPLRRRLARLVGIGLALSITSGAAAYWTTTGTGVSAGATATPLLLTVSPGTPVGKLHPGGESDVALTISNPNGYTARIGALYLDTASGTNGYSVDAGHAACGVSSLAFAAQTNNGLGWSVPPKVGGINGSLPVNLAGALAMSLTAAQACQGATFTVYVIASPDYLTSTGTTTGLVSHWRLGDDPNVADNFTGDTGTTLQSHTGEVGATWTVLAGSGSPNAVLTDANRVRRSGGYAVYTASGAPVGADYAVQADVHVRSTVPGDMTGVIGRVDTSNANGTFYYARYQQSTTAWHLMKVINGVSTNLATSATAVLTVGQTYRLRLDMIGSAIKLYVNETVTASITDATITAAGRAGLLDGDWKTGTTTASSNFTGLHLDSVRVTINTGTILTDRYGGNPGTMFGTPLLNVPGSLAGDLNAAMRFTGTNYALATRQIADDFTLEFWFASTAGIGTGAQWWAGAGLVDAEVAGAANDFGTSLRSDGRIVAGVGTPDGSIMSATGFNDGAWHHVVMTRTRSSGMVRLYVDGTLASSAGRSTASLASSPNLNIGRIGNATNYFVGALDEVAVYNTALSQVTVTDHYRIGHGS